MLVRFDCGCVGILDGDRFPVVVESCDGDGGFGFFRRDMTGKTFERLAVGEEETLIKGIAKLVGEGYRHREVKRLLTD